MALIQYAAPWDRQPQESVEASQEWANRGLIGLWNFANGTSGTVGGDVSFSGVPDVDVSSSGIGYKNPSISSNRKVILPDLSAAIGATNEATLVLILGGGNNTTQGLCNLGGANDTTQSDHYPYRPTSTDLIYSSIFKASRWVSGVTSKIDHTKPHVVGVQFRNGRQRYTQAGIELTVATNAVNPIWPSWARLLVSDNSAFAYSGSTLGAAVFNKYIEDAELLQITRSVSDAWQLFAPQPIWVPVSAGGGSPDVTVAATGVAATGSSGTASPATDKAISGQSATASSGTASPSLANALTGNAATSAGGLVSPSVTIALTGVSATTSVGTVSPSSGVTVALTGVEATTSAGSVGPGAVVAPSGQQATASVGAVSVASPDVTVALSGVSASASVGSVSASGGASVGGGMGFEMGGSKKRRIVKIRWNGYDYTLDRDALPAFLESIEEQAEEKVTKKRNAKKKPAPLARIVSAPADVMPDLQERIAAVNRSIGALWGAKDDEEEEEILWLMV